MCVETLREFDTALAAATGISENYDCASGADCVEVDPCDGRASCDVGAFLNLSGAEPFTATSDATCVCYREVDEFCPEPEPPQPGCFEGVCAGGFGGSESPIPPVTCEERAASWEQFTDILAFNDGAYGGCGVVGVGNGCTGDECRYFAVSLPELDALRAMVESHLRFNDCEPCGPALPCDAPPAVEEVDGNCRLAP